MTKVISKWMLSALLLGAGVMHFIRPAWYVKIMPPYVPWHEELVFVSGVCEVLCGACLLVPKLSRAAAWGTIALLIAVFPANLHLYQNQEILPAPPALHFLRLPLQGVLILWAYQHARRPAVDATPGD